MVRFKVVYDRDACIGAFSCVAAVPEHWSYDDDGKANLIGATFDHTVRKWVMIIDEKDLSEHKAAAEVCPVDAIVLERLDD